MGINTLTADVSDSQSVESFINLAVKKTGSIDVLFNNAGMGFGHKVDSFPDGSFEHHVAVHLFGTIYGMRYALPTVSYTHLTLPTILRV